MDLNTLKVENGSFIDEEFKLKESDVLLSVLYKKRRAYIYLLCEQQSEVDDNMVFRLFLYISRILEKHRKEYPDKPLPLVLPIVLYSGEKPWDAPLDIFEIFGEHEPLVREHFLKPYTLVDLHRMSDDDIKKEMWSGVMSFVLKHRHERDHRKLIIPLAPLLEILEQEDVQTGEPFTKYVLRYVFDNVESNDVEAFLNDAKEHFTGTARGEAMTIGEALLEKGIQQGVQQGMQQGRQEGVQLGEKNTFARLLREGILTPEEVKRLSGFAPEELEAVNFQEDEVA